MAITHLDCVQVSSSAGELEASAHEWERLLGRAPLPCASGYRVGLSNSALEIVAGEPAGHLSLAFADDGGGAALPARGVDAALRRAPAPACAGPLAHSAAAAAVWALDHVVIRSDDLDRCRAGYEAMGLRLALDRTFPERGVRLVFFRFGKVTLELSGAHPPSSDPAAGPDRLWGLAWRVPSIEVARDRLVRAGFEISEFRDGHKAGTRVFTVPRAPSGVPTLILEDPSRNDPLE